MHDLFQYDSIVHKHNFHHSLRVSHPYVESDTKKVTDPWWEFSIEEFNESHQEILESSVWWLIDECLFAYCPHKNATGCFIKLATLNANQSH
jgi:hypothetical protein